MKQRLRIGTRVRIEKLPDNVADDVKGYEGETGSIKAYGSPSDNGEHGYYILMDNELPSKRFYQDELYVYDQHGDFYCDYCDTQLITDNLPVEDWYCPNCGKAELST